MPDTYTRFSGAVSEGVYPSNNPYILKQQDYQPALSDSDYKLFKLISLSSVTLWPFTDSQPIDEEFSRLAQKWKDDTLVLSNTTQICIHPSYQRIIGMGEEIIPFILRDLEKTHAKWYWALTAITGENPISDEDAGNINKMSEAWLEWGRKRGYHI